MSNDYAVTSETLGHLAAALAAFQGVVSNVTKGKTANVQSRKGTGASYSYSYADLGSVLDVVREPLSKAGLAVFQAPMLSERGHVLISRVIHAESGEWAQSVMRLPAPDNADAQAMGSAITYARRYALVSLLGIATDDDDGKAAVAAQRRAPARAARTAPPARAAAKPVATPHLSEPIGLDDGVSFDDLEEPEGESAGLFDEELITPKQLTALHTRLTKLGFNGKKEDRDKAREFVGHLVGRELASSKDLTKAEAIRILDVSDDELGDRLDAFNVEQQMGEQDA